MSDQNASELPSVERIEEFVMQLCRLREEAIACAALMPSEHSFVAVAFAEEIFDRCYKRASHNALHIANGFASLHGFSLLEETYRSIPKYTSNKHRVSLTKEDVERTMAHASKWRLFDTN